MEKEVVAIGCTVGLIGLLSAVFAFAAEATRIRASEVVAINHEECIYPKSPALYLGLVSAGFLALAHVIINFFAGCICCNKRNLSRSSTNWTVAFVFFAISWISFVAAFLVLLCCATLNGKEIMEKIYLDNNCYVLKVGFFSGGAVLSLSSVSLGIIYYLELRSPNSLRPFWSRGIAFASAQAQTPQQSAQPAFVHEDTYNRQRIL